MAEEAESPEVTGEPGAAQEKAADEPDDGSKQPPIGRDAVQIIITASIVGVLTLSAVAAFALQPGGPGVGAIGTGAVIGGGALSLGAFLGLLFGVPRLLDQPTVSKPGDQPTPSNTRYQANTNLTEISDWLTKIIVGISLIQLGAIRDQFIALVQALAPGFGTLPSAAPFVAGLLATSTVTGFLSGYLLARIYLPRVFNEADVILRVTRESRRVVAAAVKLTIDSSQADAEAIRLVDQALTTSAQHPTEEALTEAIKRASAGTRAALVSRAADLRGRNWKSEKATMELTIPVLRALIKADEGDHFVHGQLGFALKDQERADNAGAIAELTRAIELRGDPTDAGWLFYEWNRALARARMDAIKGGVSDPATKEAILADVRLAFRSDVLRQLARDDGDFTAWAQLNKVNLARLKPA